MAIHDFEKTSSLHVFKKYWIPVILYAGFIFYVSSLPEPLGAVQIDLSLLHVPMFFVLSYLFARAMLGSSRNIGVSRAITAAIIVATAYGVLDEFHQLYVPERTFSYFDMGLDFFGAFLTVFKGWWEKLFERVNL